MAQEQWKCLIIGKEPEISDTAKLLNSSFVPTKVLKYKDGCESQIMQMVAGGDLEVIVIFCSDLPGDGVDFLRSIDKKIQSKVPTHILVDESAKKSLKQLKIFCTEETQTFSVTPFFAASAIKRRWFRSELLEKMPSSRVVHRSTDADAVDAPTAPEVPSVVSKPAEISEAKKSPKATTNVTPVARIPVLAPPPAVTSAVVPMVIPSIHNKADLENSLSKLLKGVRRNADLPKDPFVLNIVGKHGSIVELDPRRVRPLPDNPRQATNPGFSNESIMGLTHSIKEVGQLEEAMVCPIVGNKNYDAQLVDGERRHRAVLKGGVVLRATVREDISPEGAQTLYLLAIVRNKEKEPPTTFDFMKMVVRLRGPEFKLTQAEVGSILSCTGGWISQFETLSKLHSEVQQMLHGGTKKSLLTMQLGLLLCDVPIERQPAAADHIVQKKMNHDQALRYIRSVRRELGLKVSGKRNRGSSQFQSLCSLVNRNSNSFGIYLDMSPAEITQIMTNRTRSEKKEIVATLRALSQDILELAERIEK